jgi:UDP-N-acetylglucosamine 1-carboxyvinyltransferase
MLLSSDDISMVKDNIYQNRFSEVCELLQMNGKLYLKNNSLLVFPSKLLGTTVYANDLRAGFSLIVAGCIADGVTIIEHSEVILRGYSDLIAKLSNILVDIEII